MLEERLRGQDCIPLSAKGDGNCLFRSIIQSLMVQGILTNNKDKVIEYLEALATNYFAHLLTYPFVKLKYNQGDSMKEPFNSFIKMYKEYTVAETGALDLEAFGDKFCDANVPNDAREHTVLYFLQTCLRADAYSFLLEQYKTQEKELEELEKTEADNEAALKQNRAVRAVLEEKIASIEEMCTQNSWAEVFTLAPYLKEHKIAVQVNQQRETNGIEKMYWLRSEEDIAREGMDSEEFRKEYEHTIYLHYTSFHYDALVPKKCSKVQLPHETITRTSASRVNASEKLLSENTLNAGIGVADDVDFARKEQANEFKNLQYGFPENFKQLKSILISEQLTQYKWNRLEIILNKSKSSRLYFFKALEKIINEKSYTDEFNTLLSKEVDTVFERSPEEDTLKEDTVASPGNPRLR